MYVEDEDASAPKDGETHPLLKLFDLAFPTGSEKRTKLPNGAHGFQNVASSWIDSYQSRLDAEDDAPNQTHPVYEVLTLILAASAGRSPRSLPLKVANVVAKHLSNAEEDEEDPDDVETLVDTFCQDVSVPKQYPISRKFYRIRFERFWRDFFEQLGEATMYETDFLDTVVSWLVSCSSAPLRALRRTASLAAFAVASQIAKFAVDADKRLSIHRRRVDIERKKKSTSKRAADLEKACDTLETRRDFLRKLFKAIFNGVFVHRSDDVEPMIRADAAVYFGQWGLIDPGRVLKQYVGYLQKQIGDADATVRLRAAESLTRLVEKLPDESVTTIKSFLTRKREQILGLAVDVDDRVLAAGISLCKSMRRRGLIAKQKEEERTSFENLLFEGSDAVKRKAASFLSEQVLGLSNASGEQSTPKQQLLALIELAERHAESSSVAHVDAIVRAFQSETKALDDCGAMCELLLTDSKGSKSLTDYQSLALSRMLVASFNTLIERSEAKSFKHRFHSEIKLERTKKTLRAFSVTLLNELPKLFTRFLADANVVRELAELPKLINVDVCALNEKTKTYSELLKHLHKVFETHTDSVILHNVAAAFQHFAETSHGRQREASDALGRLVRTTTKRFEALSTTWKKGTRMSDNDLSIALRRLQHLIRWIDIRRWMPADDAFDRFVRLLDMCSSRLFPTTGGINAAAAHVMWELPGLVVMWTNWAAMSLLRRSFDDLDVVESKDAAEDMDDDTLQARLRDLRDAIGDVGERLAKMLGMSMENRATMNGEDYVMWRRMVKSIFVALGDFRLFFSNADSLSWSVSDEGALAMARASKSLLLESPSNDDKSSDVATPDDDEQMILRTMIGLSEPGMNVSKTFEASFLLSRLGQCRTDTGNELVEQWSRRMGKLNASRYLLLQQKMLQRKFLECRESGADDDASREACIENYIELLNTSKKLSRFYGVGCPPKALAPAYVSFLREGMTFAVAKLPAQLGFLDVLEYYVRVLSIPEKMRVRKMFDDMIAENAITEVRENDHDALGANEGMWQAFDSFNTSLSAKTSDRRKRDRRTTARRGSDDVERVKVAKTSKDASPQSANARKNDESISAMNLSDEDREDNDGAETLTSRQGSDGKRRKALNLDNLSDDEGGTFGHSQDFSGFGSRRRRR